MKNSKSLKRGLARIRRLADLKLYERAFAETDKLLHKWPDNPEVLVLWANLLQSQDADMGPPLEKAKEALQRAVNLDEQSALPCIELGQYLFALDDDTRAATQYFDRAIGLSRRFLKEALLCQTKALLELGRRSEAMSCLAEAYWLEARNGKSRTDDIQGEEFLQRVQEMVNGLPVRAAQGEVEVGG